jgi:hypothetical protein
VFQIIPRIHIMRRWLIRQYVEDTRKSTTSDCRDIVGMQGGRQDVKEGEESAAGPRDMKLMER